MSSVKTFGFSVYSDDLANIPLDYTGAPKLLNTISPNSYGIATKDSLFRTSLIESDYLVLDGVYFALASILLQGRNIRRNQGPDVYYHFMNRMNRDRGRVFFLGASEKTLKKIKIKAAAEYSNVEVAYYSPPFKPEFTDEENNEMIARVNKYSPDVLFVGMTCPKQEKWAFQNKEKLQTRLICCVGAVFDWYAGNQRVIHPLWWKLRLGWLKRTIDRPEILKRYPNIGIFFWHLLLANMGIKKYRHGIF